MLPLIEMASICSSWASLARVTMSLSVVTAWPAAVPSVPTETPYFQLLLWRS